MKIIKFNELSSTNDYLKENYQTLDNYTICTTSYQTKGKGRISRNWESQKNQNILMSILVKDFKKRTNFSNITLLVGCVVHKFLSKYTNSLKIKWPNDILVDNKKIVGILSEAKSINNQIDSIIIGIGININQTTFSSDINNLTTSLSLLTNNIYNNDELIIELSNMLITKLDNYLNLDDSYLNYLKDFLYAKGELISFFKDNTIHQGILLDVGVDGKLIINENNELFHLESGEIKIIRK